MSAPLIYGLNITEKPCSQCHIVKPVSEFGLTSKCGVWKAQCNQCHAKNWHTRNHALHPDMKSHPNSKWQRLEENSDAELVNKAVEWQSK